MSSLTTTLKLLLTATLTRAGDLSNDRSEINYNADQSWQAGTGNGQASAVWSDTRTLTQGATEDLDLSALTNALGEAVAFTAVKGILIRAASANTGDISIGPRSTQGFSDYFGDASDRIRIPPGGTFLITSPVAGKTITNNADDMLTVANLVGAASVSYDVIIWGVG